LLQNNSLKVLISDDKKYSHFKNICNKIFDWNHSHFSEFIFEDNTLYNILYSSVEYALNSISGNKHFLKYDENDKNDLKKDNNIYRVAFICEKSIKIPLETTIKYIKKHTDISCFIISSSLNNNIREHTNYTKYIVDNKHIISKIVGDEEAFNNKMSNNYVEGLFTHSKILSINFLKWCCVKDE
jgi:hypothetical protein